MCVCGRVWRAIDDKIPPQGQVSHRRRFQEEFGGPQSDHPKVPKPGTVYCQKQVKVL